MIFVMYLNFGKYDLFGVTQVFLECVCVCVSEFKYSYFTKIICKHLAFSCVLSLFVFFKAEMLGAFLKILIFTILWIFHLTNKIKCRSWGSNNARTTSNIISLHVHINKWFSWNVVFKIHLNSVYLHFHICVQL